MNVETDIDTSGIFSPLHSADEGDGFHNYVELSDKGYNRIFKAQRNGKWYILCSGLISLRAYVSVMHRRNAKSVANGF